MAIDYLRNRPWSDWTREERFFCAMLYMHTMKDPAAFAARLIKTARLDISAEGDWDLGFEVCFYRDFLWQQGKSARKLPLPAKRTFDLCLFGERDIIVIEAKVCEKFGKIQAEEFKKEKERIGRIDGLKHLGIHMVALASSVYFANAARFGRKETLAAFDGHVVTWAAIANWYKDPLLERAEQMYREKPWAAIAGPVSQQHQPDGACTQA